MKFNVMLLILFLWRERASSGVIIQKSLLECSKDVINITQKKISHTCVMFECIKLFNDAICILTESVFIVWSVRPTLFFRLVFSAVIHFQLDSGCYAN